MTIATNKDFLDVMRLITLERKYFQGLVRVAFPEVVDALHIHKAHECVERAAERIDEPVLLSMGNIEQLYIKGEGWLPAVDHSKQMVLDSQALQSAIMMSGAVWTAPEYLLDAHCGTHRQLAELRVQELREAGLRSLKGGWTDSLKASSVCYFKPISP